MKRLATATVFALTAMLLLVPPLFGQYSSTTSITASNDSGDINGTIYVNYTDSCADIDSEGDVTLIIGEDDFGAIGVDYETFFDSDQPPINIIYGPGSYLLQTTFEGFSEGDMGCTVSGSSASTTVVVPRDSSVLTLSPASPVNVREGQKLQL